MTDEVRVTIEAVPRTGLTEQRLRQAVARHPGVPAALEVAGPDRLTVAFAPGLGHDPGENAPFQATVFDPAGSGRGRGTQEQPLALRMIMVREGALVSVGDLVKL